MEKRALLAIVLSVAIMAIWTLFFAPAPRVPSPAAPAGAPGQIATPPAPAEPGAGTSPAGPLAGTPAGQGQAEPPAPAGAAAPTPAGPVPIQPVAAAAREEFRLITAMHDVRLSNEGGCVTWWRLTRYTVDGGIPVDLIPDQARALGVLPLRVEVDGDPEATKALAKALYVHELSDIPAGDPSGLGPGKRVTFSWADAAGLSVRKSLEMPDEGYVGRVSLEVSRQGRPVPATLVWASGLAQKAEDDTRGYGHIEGEAVVDEAQQVRRMAPAKVTSAMSFGAPSGPPVRWAGLDSTYFASLIIPPDGPGAAATPAPDQGLAVAIVPHEVPPDAGSTTKPPPLLTAGLKTSGGGSYRLFVGPKDYYLLKSMGHDLEHVIDFSRFSLIYLCTKGLFLALTWINSWVGNYGWSIIILTVLVRVVFFPLTYKSSITMRQTSKKMSKIQPRVKAIQDRYRKMKKSMETQRKMNEEVMALYKKEGVNPMGNLGGCLPLLLQMPIFIAFYNLLAVTIEMRHAPFALWIQDLSRRDPWYITPLLMGGSWLAQQWMTSSSIPDPTQRRMMMFMPVMFTFFMMNMPSGLVIYWLTSNLLGMAQQYLTNKKADQLDAEAHSRGEAA